MTISACTEDIGAALGASDSQDLNPELSEYEKIRARNIVKNNARLRALGLISALEENQSNARAWGVAHPFSERTNSMETKPTKKKRKAEEKPLASPTRKSARIQGLEPEFNVFSRELPDEDRAEQRKALVTECREARQRAALRVMEQGGEKAARENPTATYEHCLMRVRTMTEKGLKNRVKAIERAAGKHCVVKMGIFKCCLQDENMWDLAELASEALERLKALQAPPDENDK
jgi:hypothetical protein